MNKTAIEWCDYTWNPVTGCKDARIFPCMFAELWVAKEITTREV